MKNHREVLEAVSLIVKHSKERIHKQENGHHMGNILGYFYVVAIHLSSPTQEILLSWFPTA